MGFGLVIGFIEQLYTQLVTILNYSPIANSHSAIHNSKHLSPLSLLCHHKFSGSGFQRVDVPLPLGSQTVPKPQLPTTDSNSSQGLNCSSHLTN
jgi:hypothetical protein